jgi:hypothetical protein
MKDNKHIQSFNEHQENLNISDVSDSKLNFSINWKTDNLESLKNNYEKFINVVKDGESVIKSITFDDFENGVVHINNEFFNIEITKI